MIYEPIHKSYLDGKHLIQSFTTIDRCREAHANLIKNRHPHAKELAILIDARMKVLDFDQGRPFGTNV